MADQGHSLLKSLQNMAGFLESVGKYSLEVFNGEIFGLVHSPSIDGCEIGWPAHSMENAGIRDQATAAMLWLFMSMAHVVSSASNCSICWRSDAWLSDVSLVSGETSAQQQSIKNQSIITISYGACGTP